MSVDFALRRFSWLVLYSVLRFDWVTLVFDMIRYDTIVFRSVSGESLGASVSWVPLSGNISVVLLDFIYYFHCVGLPRLHTPFVFLTYCRFTRVWRTVRPGRCTCVGLASGRVASVRLISLGSRSTTQCCDSHFVEYSGVLIRFIVPSFVFVWVRLCWVAFSIGSF